MIELRHMDVCLFVIIIERRHLVNGCTTQLMWLLRFDVISLSIVSGRNNMRRYQYCMICFGICMQSP